MPASSIALPAGLLRRCLAQVRHGITIADAATRDMPLVYANDAFLRMTGYDRGELLGRNCRLLQQRKRRQPASARIRAALDARTPVRAQLRNYRKDGGAFWNDLSLTPVFNRHGRLTHYIGVQEDVTQPLRTRANLLRHQRKLRELARRLEQREDSERQRIACDLHDHLGQTLTACRIQLGELARALGRNPPPPALSQACALVQQALEQTRGLMFDLSPPVLRELGLCAALQWLADQTAARSSMRVAVHVPARPPSLPEDLAGFVFRATRELLLNAAKHARASRLRLSLDLTPKSLTLEIHDDGRGLPARAVRARSDPAGSTRLSGFGLFSIRERAEHLGGALLLRSRSGKGTRAVLSLPLPRPRRAIRAANQT